MGIKICQDWLDNVESFIDWVVKQYINNYKKWYLYSYLPFFKINEKCLSNST